jgi:hypothetical protein
LIQGFELMASWLLSRYFTTWATSPTLFCVGFFWDTVSQTSCLGWLQTVILLISASWVARIAGMSHWHPVRPDFWRLDEAPFRLVTIRFQFFFPDLFLPLPLRVPGNFLTIFHKLIQEEKEELLEGSMEKGLYCQSLPLSIYLPSFLPSFLRCWGAKNKCF